jgi:myosin heavy subunit
MADEIVKVIKIEAQGSEQTVKQLRSEISSLRDALLNTEKGSEEYAKAVEQLAKNQKKLNDVMTAGKDTFKNSRQELRELKNELDRLVPGTAEYNAAFQRAAEITHTLQERQEMLKYSAADLGTQLDNMRAIGSSLAAGFNAVNAVIALTGSESEELQKVMVKLQAGIALVQGLQGLEGMTKRMRGFVEGVTNMVFHTNAATTAVAAETTALGANAAAQEANTVATNAATVATNGFKKALVATGIGAIVVLIGTLVANWEELKDMIGLSNEKLERFQGVMDKIRTVLGGVANVIMNAFVASVKNAITALTTLGSVAKNVLTFQFGKAADAAKEGWAKINENTKKGLAIQKNYQEGAARTAARIQDKRTREAMARSAEELNETIKDNEAKYGSDWKYTEDGKKLYTQYFDTKLKAYKKDSKEYKDLMRQKWSYDREYQEHLDKASKTQVKQAKEVTDTRLEEAKKIEQRAKDSAKTEEQLLTEKFNKEKELLIEYHRDTAALEAEYQRNLQKIRDKAAADEKAKADKAAADAEKALNERTRKALKMSDRRLQTSEDANSQAVKTIELEYSLKEAKESGSLSFNDIIEQTNRIYEANKQHLLEQAAEYKSLMKNTEIDKEARENAERDYNNTMAELRNLDTQNLIDNTNLQREAIEQQIEMYSDLATSIGDIFASIGDILEEDIKNKVKNGEITQEEGEKQFKAVKAMQIAEATINTIAGAIAAFMSCQKTYPQPWAAVIGGVQAAAVTAAGVAQIAKIKNTQLGGGGATATATAAAVQTAPEEYVPQYTQNATGESEIVRLADSIRNQRVYVVESDITEAQNRSKVRVTESTW